MGRASKRKAEQKNPVKAEIVIDISPLTGMYRVIVILNETLNFVFDSHSLYENALKQIKILKPILEKFSWGEWQKSYHQTLKEVVQQVIEIEGVPSKEEMIKGTIGTVRVNNTKVEFDWTRQTKEQQFKDWPLAIK